MLTKKQVEEIKAHLERAQNPVFFFDNDQDGLCSFLLLQRYIGRGKGVAIKSFPALDENYFRKVEELNADYIFILDKPIVSDEFLDKVKERNIPVVWIDHHGVQGKVLKFVDYYNPVLNKHSTNEPVSALCYQVTQKKDDLWLAVLGCVSDAFYPDFYPEFRKKYPDLSIDSKKPFDIFYGSGIGMVAKILGFGLKDTTTNVVNMLRFLMKVKTPYEVLEENKNNSSFHKRFNEINSKYQKLLLKAKEIAKKSGKILFFQYSGETSMSGTLSNELIYLFEDKFVVVAYVRGLKVNISARGKNVKKIVLKAIEGLEMATGGGHDNAIGAQVRFDDLDKFRERLEGEISK